jgi:transposase-like protein
MSSVIIHRENRLWVFSLFYRVLWAVSTLFREQIAKLVVNGKPVTQIVREYGLAKSTIVTWTSKYQNADSFRDARNRNSDEAELI